MTGLKLCDTINILGVTFRKNLSMSSHISNISGKCNKLFYVIRILHSYGLGTVSCRDMFVSLILSRATYAISSWSGFCNKQELMQLNKLVHHGKTLGYCSKADGNIEDLIVARDMALFRKIINDRYHVLHKYLTDERDSKYNLCGNIHNRQLPWKTCPYDDRNFILHILYKALNLTL